MAVTQDDIKTGEFSSDGSPFVKISVVSADSLIFSLDGSPWWGLGPDETTTTTTTTSGFNQWKIYVGDTLISAIYVGATEVTTAYLGATELRE